jgi:hypothetical protein
MKCCITGTSRGIGKIFSSYFFEKGWQVISFDRSHTIDDIILMSQDCDLFINNAYDKDLQLILFKRLKVKSMIICGSVVTDFPDIKLPEYTEHKIALEKYFKESAPKNSLLLKISNESYNNPQLLINAIEFWMNNLKVNVISFSAGEPNR